MPRKISRFFGLLTAAAMLLSTAPSALAATPFDPSYIISDEELQDTAGWTKQAIDDFLRDKDSYLYDYRTVGLDGKIQSASDIIYEASIEHGISPKYSLVTLQKEQSLITDPDPDNSQLDWATGYAVCDSCSTRDPALQKHRGFAKQVNSSAALMRWYYDNLDDKAWIKRANQRYTIDNKVVRPKTNATGFLYTYTPHLHGNENFWKLWNKWFAANWPSGTLLKAKSDGTVWLIQGDNKRKFKNQAVLLSRANPDMVITVPDAELTKYTTGPSLDFPNYSILKAGGTTYLLDFDTIRPFASDEVIKKLGYNPQEIVTVSTNDLAGLNKGATISADDPLPQGAIYEVGGLYYLFKDNTLQPLLDKAVAKANFRNLPIVKKTRADLKGLKVSDDLIKFADGTLLSDGSNTYVMEDGQKRKFASDKTFSDMGYKRSNVTEVSRLVLVTIPNGETVFFGGSTATLASFNTPDFLGDEITSVENAANSSLPAYIVAEYPSGKIIAGKNIDQKRAIASFAKVFVGNEAVRQGLDQAKITTYNSAQHGEGGYSLWLSNGVKMTNKDILNTMLIGSYNNVAKLIPTAVGLSEQEIIDKTNAWFREVGANNTKIADVTGLSENNVSTARDLLKLFTFSEHYVKIVMGKPRHDFVAADSSRSFSISHTNKLSFNNPNYRIVSSKTGFTEEAQSVLFLLIESKKTDQKYVVITMGNPNYLYRFSEPDRIAKWAANRAVTVASN